MTLFESCSLNKIGVHILSKPGIRKDSFLFGEGQSRIVVAVDPQQEDAFKALVEHSSVECWHLGHTTTEDSFILDGEVLGRVSDWSEEYNLKLKKIMDL